MPFDGGILKSVGLNTEFFIALREVRGVRTTARGIELSVDNEKVRIDFVQSDIIRIKMSCGGSFDMTPTFAVENDVFDKVKFTVNKTKKQIYLQSKDIRVVITFNPFTIDVFRSDGSCVLESDDERAFMLLNDRWAVKRKKKSGDGFFGFGQKTGFLNQNGRYLQMWTSDIIWEAGFEGAFATDYDPYYIAIPFFYHLPETHPEKASGSFIDNGYRLHIDLRDSESYVIIGDGGQYTEYVFAGPSIKTILHMYAELTGYMKAPPLWAVGYHQCRWYDYNENDIRDIEKKYRTKKLPCDTLWLDIVYMDDFRIFTWNYKKFSNPPSLIQEMRNKGFRMVTIVDPGVMFEPGYHAFDDGVERNAFCKTKSGTLFVGKIWPGHTVFPDFVKVEGRAWWAEEIAKHIESGLAGIWIDMNEPTLGEADYQSMRFDRDGANYEHERYHNQYGFLMARGTYEGLKKAHPDKRTFVLSRSGFAGIQRYSANWMGDNASRWEHLAMGVSMCCNMSLSGQPFVGCDIGGFCENATEELLIRWYQCAVFYPFFRNHNAKDTTDHYPWTFGKKAESLIRNSLELRYSLLPYIYTSFMRCAETGDPIMRPLVYDFQHDKKTRDVYDQFMSGDHILVAPIVTKGARNRTVHFPDGDWYEYNSTTHHRGRQVIKVKAPISVCPVFVRAGAVVPTAKVVQTTAEYAPDEITLNVYVPLTNGEWVSYLHEDDGETDRYLNGEYYRSEFRVVRKGKHITLQGTITGRGYPGFQRKTFRIRVIGNKVNETIIKNTGKNFTINLDDLI